MSTAMARSRAGIVTGWRPSTSGSPRASRSPIMARPARLQYGLTERAAALGWAASRVMVIDEDLGRSAANAAERPGFARLVAELTMGHVGLVLGLEMSRLARAGRDWHQLTGAVLAGRGAAGRRGRGLRSELVQRPPPARVI